MGPTLNLKTTYVK